MKVLENHHQRLIERLAQHDALDCVKRAAFFDLPIHLRERIETFDDAEQAEQIGQRVFQTSIEDRDLARNFLTAGSFVVFARDLEIVAQQIDHR